MISSFLSPIFFQVTSVSKVDELEGKDLTPSKYSKSYKKTMGSMLRV